MNRNQVLAFVLTFFAYAALHSLREGWSLSKARIKDIQELDTSKEYLGLIDTCYLLSYSFGMMTLGNLIRKISLKHFIALGMILSSIFYMMVPLYY
jgi:sugar phosphate permease